MAFIFSNRWPQRAVIFENPKELNSEFALAPERPIITRDRYLFGKV